MKFKHVLEAAALARRFIADNNNDPHSPKIEYFICNNLDFYPTNFRRLFIKEIYKAQDFKQQIAAHKAKKAAAL